MHLPLSLAQFRVTSANPEENLVRAELLVAEAARGGSRLICFPEMWTTGFQWEANARLASAQAVVAERIASWAQTYRIWIHGSMLMPDPRGGLANTSILFSDEGRRAGVYRKTHLFTLLQEERHMTPGDTLVSVETPWGRVGLAICYDLRFPELFRTYALQGVDFVLCPAAFPHPRRVHWQVLARARAIENQMFFIGTNQVGTENFGGLEPVTYFGSSLVIDPWGTVLVEGDEQEALLSVTIDPTQTAITRAKMTVLQDRRPELYRLG